MQTATSNRQYTFQETRAAFLRDLSGKNKSVATMKAYQTDLSQFFSFLTANSVTATAPAAVTKLDISDYLSSLAKDGLSGVSRARKLAAIREYFRFLESFGLIAKSPVVGIATPKKDQPTRMALRPEEYLKMLAQAGGNPRDYAILQVFLQTGIRVSELCDLLLTDIDLASRTVTVRAGKGMRSRVIALEKKGVQALKSYLAVRPETPSAYLFLNKYGQPLSGRAIQLLVRAYREQAGITKPATPHSFRHTFGTYKAEKGVDVFQLRDWLGHKNLTTTQIYVHLARANSRRVMEATSL